MADDQVTDRDIGDDGADGPDHDGNVLAGPLSEVFAVDLTTAEGHCASCGLVSAVATLRVYGRAPGLVARCPGCDSIVLRIVRGPDCVWLDLTGASRLRIPVSD